MDARAFLATRAPAPPDALAAWVGRAELDGVEPLEGLAAAGLAALDRARRSPGRVRESAFHLLAADALLTWACEAALEAPDPVTALEGLLVRAGDGR